jgi:hypothetical protein
MTIESQTLEDHPIGLFDRLSVDRLPLAYILLDAGDRVREWNTAAQQLGVRGLLEGQSDLSLVGEAGDGDLPPLTESGCRVINCGILDH